MSKRIEKLKKVTKDYRPLELKDTYLVCNVCDFEDSKKSNGDCDWCGECGSVEQGFTELYCDTDEPA